MNNLVTILIRVLTVVNIGNVGNIRIVAVRGLGGGVERAAWGVRRIAGNSLLAGI